jgi:hypothetical protein
MLTNTYFATAAKTVFRQHLPSLRPRYRKGLITVLLLAGLAANTPTAQAQCPMCRLNVKNSMASGTGGKGYGLNDGITYLLVTPYMLMAGIAGATYYYYRRKRRQYRPAF